MLLGAVLLISLPLVLCVVAREKIGPGLRRDKVRKVRHFDRFPASSPRANGSIRVGAFADIKILSVFFFVSLAKKNQWSPLTKNSGSRPEFKFFQIMHFITLTVLNKQV